MHGGVGRVLAQRQGEQRPSGAEVGQRPRERVRTQGQGHRSLPPVGYADPRHDVDAHVGGARPRAHGDRQRRGRVVERRTGARSCRGRGEQPADRGRVGRSDRAIPAGHVGQRRRLEPEQRHGGAGGRRLADAGDRAQHRAGTPGQRCGSHHVERVGAGAPDGEPGVRGHVVRRGVDAAGLQGGAVGAGEDHRAHRGGQEADGDDGAQGTVDAGRGREPGRDGTDGQPAAGPRRQRHPEPRCDECGGEQEQHREEPGERVASSTGDADRAARRQQRRHEHRCCRHGLDDVPRGGCARGGPEQHDGGEHDRERGEDEHRRQCVEHRPGRLAGGGGVQRLRGGGGVRRGPAEREPEQQPGQHGDRRTGERERGAGAPRGAATAQESSSLAVVATQAGGSDEDEAEHQGGGRAADEGEPALRRGGAGVLAQQHVVGHGEHEGVDLQGELVGDRARELGVRRDAQAADAERVDRADPAGAAREARQRLESLQRIGIRRQQHVGVRAGVERAREQQRVGAHRRPDDDEPERRVERRGARRAGGDDLAAGGRARRREAAGGEAHLGLQHIARAEAVGHAGPVRDLAEEHLRADRKVGEAGEPGAHGRVVARLAVDVLRPAVRRHHGALARRQLGDGVLQGLRGHDPAGGCREHGQRERERDAEREQQPARRVPAQPGTRERGDDTHAVTPLIRLTA